MQGAFCLLLTSADLYNYMSYRVGSGVDFHQLTEGRKFRLGGIDIPYHKGSLGHSDADVLLHAICDALLGALALGDIGKHFPDTDEEYRNIDSTILLGSVYSLITGEGYLVVNVDTTICLQAPKILIYVPEMQKIIASILNVTVKDVSIKATTTEKLGFEGREEGVIAYATVLLKQRAMV